MKKIFSILLAASMPLCIYAATDDSKDNDRNVPPDNTGKNVRDRDHLTLTPTDQEETEADRTIVQQIRQKLVKDESLSTYAKNIKVIVRDGKVTLRGPVRSENERRDVVAAAKKVQGVKKIDNQLEITTEQSR